ncbi:MAG: hypothetical protein ACFCU3_00145 [Verrucomicrobiales bacterium]
MSAPLDKIPEPANAAEVDEQLSQVKHTLNNFFAVLFAQAQLANNDAERMLKLKTTIEERGPELATWVNDALNGIQQHLRSEEGSS